MKFPASRIAIISILAILLLLVVAEILLSSWITRKVQQKITEAGIVVESLDVSLIRQSLSVKGFNWLKADKRAGSDSTYVRADELTLKGINIYQLVRHKSFQVRTLSLSGGSIAIAPRRDSTSHPTDSLPQISGLEIGTLRLIDTDIRWQSDSARTWSGNADVTLHRIVLKDHEGALNLSSLEVTGDVE